MSIIPLFGLDYMYNNALNSSCSRTRTYCAHALAAHMYLHVLLRAFTTWIPSPTAMMAYTIWMISSCTCVYCFVAFASKFHTAVGPF